MNNRKTMTRTQLEVHYRVMMKRIAKNLSAEKLSFLIGRKADYVSNAEMLVTDPYSTEELTCIAAALEETDVENFCPLVADDNLVHVKMERAFAADKCNYQCVVINADHTEEIYFMLQENSAESILLIENNEYDACIAREAITVLIKVGYFFQSHLPVKIYHRINQYLGVTLSPTYIENALNSFCTEDQKASLQIEQNSEKRFVYIES